MEWCSSIASEHQPRVSVYILCFHSTLSLIRVRAFAVVVSEIVISRVIRVGQLLIVSSSILRRVRACVETMYVFQHSVRHPDIIIKL